MSNTRSPDEISSRNLNQQRTVQTDFDFSTPEAQAALAGVSELVLEIREEVRLQVLLYERKIGIYEKTLGLAVPPVLLRRVMKKLFRRMRARG